MLSPHLHRRANEMYGFSRLFVLAILSAVFSLTNSAESLAAKPADTESKPNSKPSDIQILHKLTGPASDQWNVKALERELTDLALRRTNDISKSRGYPATLQSTNPVVRMYLVQRIKTAIGTEEFFSEPRRKAVLTLGFKIMSGELSEQAIAYAASQPPPPRRRRTR